MWIHGRRAHTRTVDARERAAGCCPSADKNTRRPRQAKPRANTAHSKHTPYTQSALLNSCTSGSPLMDPMFRMPLSVCVARFGVQLGIAEQSCKSSALEGPGKLTQCLSIYTCRTVHRDVHIYGHTYTSIHIPIHAYITVRRYVHINTHIYVQSCIYMRIDKHIDMYVPRKRTADSTPNSWTRRSRSPRMYPVWVQGLGTCA